MARLAERDRERKREWGFTCYDLTEGRNVEEFGVRHKPL